MHFVAEKGEILVTDRAGSRLSRLVTVGFYPCMTALTSDHIVNLDRVKFEYRGKSGPDNHRVYKLNNDAYAYCACEGNSSVVIVGLSVIERK